jgi:hypothetical protein
MQAELKLLLLLSELEWGCVQCAAACMLAVNTVLAIQ